jgi:hypothetical protein
MRWTNGRQSWRADFGAEARIAQCGIEPPRAAAPPDFLVGGFRISVAS